MQTYINQLIEDLTAAQSKENAINRKLIEEDFEAHIAELERYMNGEGKQRIRKIIGKKKEAFPPVERLTDQQLNAVSEALLECLYSWNITIDLPKNIPAALQYKVLVDALKYKVVIVSSGFIHLELCHYDSECCPFGKEFCRCLDTEEDKKIMNSI